MANDAGYGWMEPKKKRRQLFSTKEYQETETIEVAYWMAREETKLIPWLP